MKPSELLALLQECYRERLRLMLRHQAVARHVAEFDFNNTYQYILAREETHLSWLRDAIEELGGTVTNDEREPAIEASATSAALMSQDAREAQAFVDRWRPRVEAVTNARHKGMLRVILGETLEHKRFFEQGAAGQEDLLGRRVDAGARRGAVIATRWVGD
ncbi:MAG TPA: hypothetical protein VNK41_10355 [Vicinamibacterales bacterium]|nr:hypothetical protein [Vicinamibacterales bacterium]